MLNGVAGTIKIQGITTNPVDADYFDIAGALYDSTTAGKDGALFTTLQETLYG